MKATSISTHCRIIPRPTRKNTFAPLLAILPTSQPKPAIFDPVTVVVAFTGITVPAVKAPSTRLPLLRNPRLVFIVFPPQVGALVGNTSSCLWMLRCEQVPSAGDAWCSDITLTVVVVVQNGGSIATTLKEIIGSAVTVEIG